LGGKTGTYNPRHVRGAEKRTKREKKGGIKIDPPTNTKKTAGSKGGGKKRKTHKGKREEKRGEACGKKRGEKDANWITLGK